MTIQQKIINNFIYLNKTEWTFFDNKSGGVLSVFANLESINDQLVDEERLKKFYREISDESKRKVIQQLVEEKLELLGL